MIKFILCSKETYTKEEMCRKVLFEKANPNKFVKAFVFEGVQYYKRIGV